MSIVFSGVASYFVLALIVVSCTYTSLSIVKDIVHLLKEIFHKLKGGEE